MPELTLTVLIENSAGDGLISEHGLSLHLCYHGPSTMGPAPEEILTLGSRLFSARKVEQVWTGHCTGAPAFELLHGAFPAQVNALFSGLVLEF